MFDTTISVLIGISIEFILIYIIIKLIFNLTVYKISE